MSAEHKIIAQGLVNYCAACDKHWALSERIDCPLVTGEDETFALDPGPVPRGDDIPIPASLRKDAVKFSKLNSAIPGILDEARDTFMKRNADYGENYKRFGALLIALFPEGGIPPITDAASADRLAALIDCAGKLHRYAHNFETGGHRDSARDLVVYAAMLEEATEL